MTGDYELHNWALQNRKMLKIKGENYWFAPVEYVILRKLEYYREGGAEKHLHDIAGFLAVYSKHIDFKKLEIRINKNKLKREWEKAKSVTR